MSDEITITTIISDKITVRNYLRSNTSFFLNKSNQKTFQTILSNKQNL